MTLTACALGGTPRLQYLTPTFQPADLTCKPAPTGQLPSTTTNEEAANRIIDNDEAGEDCRQKLAHAKMKVDTFNEIVAQVNNNKHPSKDKK